MDEISVASFAKINWILKILGKRGDGFHEIATVFQTIDLRDRLRFEAQSSEEVSLEVRGRPVAQGSDNLLTRTALLLRERLGVRRGVRMRLDKKIPVGAGLGGGSGNAAVALLALNRLWDLGLDDARLRSLAAELGSDVAFFLSGGTAAGTGRGEILTPLPDLPETDLLLLYPGFEISAREAYESGRWGPLKTGPELTNREAESTILRFRAAVAAGQDAGALAENDFDGPLLAQRPPLARARRALTRAGCRRVILCGSGSTLLGLAPRETLAEAAEKVSREGLGEVTLCRTLSGRRYRDILGQSGLATVL